MSRAANVIGGSTEETTVGQHHEPVKFSRANMPDESRHKAKGICAAISRWLLTVAMGLQAAIVALLLVLLPVFFRPVLFPLFQLAPGAAEKVMEITGEIVVRDKITTLMITHNMKDAIVHGNRLIMMYEGRVALDIAGEDKKKLTVEDLLARFGQATGSDEADDKLLLG